MSRVHLLRRRLERVLHLAVVLGAAGGAAVAAAQESATVPILEYARDPVAIVVRYTQHVGEIGEPDAGPSVTVYGDGRVVAHNPRFMKRAGDYALRLGEDELHRLLLSLADKGVLTFDPEAARRMKREAAAEQRRAAAAGGGPVTVHEVSDAPLTVIEIRLERYTPAGAGAAEARNVEKRIVWYGLAWDAEHHPSIPGLVNLAAAERELRALMRRPDLTKIE